jgi:hypothetical protein
VYSFRIGESIIILSRNDNDKLIAGGGDNDSYYFIERNGSLYVMFRQETVFYVVDIVAG